MSAPPSKKEASKDATPAGPRLFGRVFGLLFGSRIRLGIVVTALIVVISVVTWRVTRIEPPSTSMLLSEALELLDDRDNVLAREQARLLAQEIHLRAERDPDFPGGAEFLLGMIAFHNAEEAEEPTREPKYLKAISWLRQAYNQGLIDERQSEWSMALGTSLYRVGSPTASRPLLEEAVVSAPYGVDGAMSLLIDTYLDLKRPEELARALELGKALTARDLSETTRDRAWLQLAQVHMARNEPDEAEQALKNVSERSWTLGTRVFNAQTQIARREFRAALRELEKVASDGGLERTFPRQASYLMGVCAENDNDLDSAITYYERTATKYERTHEAVAATARAANLLRSLGRNEEALAAFRAALRTVRNPDDFRNRWLTIDDFRQLVLDGWGGWMGTLNFDEAIQLSKAMPPLFPEAQSRELGARARQGWAEFSAKKLAAAGNDAPASLRDEVLRRWRETGTAWTELAAVQRTAPNYPEILWGATEAFTRGRAVHQALEQLDAFLETNPRRLLPLALVRRGSLLLDIDRATEAREHFQRVVKQFPTDPAVFEAQFQLGNCAVELGELDAAEAAWRAVLTSPELTPDAEQWRQSLFALGRLLCHRADESATSQLNAVEETGPAPSEAMTRAWKWWDEAALRLDEFLRRYADAAESTEARFLLARALQRSAGQYQIQLPQAETENARVELLRAMDGRLELANAQYQQLRSDLLERSESHKLDEFQTRILANAFFEVAHTFFALRKYEQAVVAYNGAINRNPLDPAVILACLQLAECYERTGRPYDARSMVQQARIVLGSSADEVFSASKTSLGRDDWNGWIDWAAQVRKAPIAKGP